jgi:hypothetical protein
MGRDSHRAAPCGTGSEQEPQQATPAFAVLGRHSSSQPLDASSDTASDVRDGAAGLVAGARSRQHRCSSLLAVAGPGDHLLRVATRGHSQERVRPAVPAPERPGHDDLLRPRVLPPGEVPTIGTVLAWAANAGVDLSGAPPDVGPWTPDELAGRHWDSVALWWRVDWSPLPVSMDHREDHQSPRRGIFADERGWARERLQAVPCSPPRDQVLAHLRQSRFLVTISLPISALDDETMWEGVSVLLGYFIEHHRAMVHVENDGFYQAEIVALETDW